MGRCLRIKCTHIVSLIWFKIKRQKKADQSVIAPNSSNRILHTVCSLSRSKIGTCSFFSHSEIWYSGAYFWSTCECQIPLILSVFQSHEDILFRNVSFRCLLIYFKFKYSSFRYWFESRTNSLLFQKRISSLLWNTDRMSGIRHSHVDQKSAPEYQISLWLKKEQVLIFYREDYSW